MLIAGFIAVCAILLSPAVSKPQVKKDKATEKETVLVQAPSDAIPGSAVKMEQPSIPVLTEIKEAEKKEFLPPIDTREATKYFKILLRTLIAPNAP